jgi:hypothetical protein
MMPSLRRSLICRNAFLEGAPFFLFSWRGVSNAISRMLLEMQLNDVENHKYFFICVIIQSRVLVEDGLDI